MKKIKLIVTSDLHAHYSKTKYLPDYTILQTARVIRQLKEEVTDLTITIDLGDFMQGSIFSTYSTQELQHAQFFVKAMNAIGYDYQVLGNHEFNESADYYEAALRQLNAQILDANIISRKTGLTAFGKAYEIIDVEGIKVGIIGLTTSIVPSWENPSNIEDLEFQDAFDILDNHIGELRPKVNILVVAYHGSLGDGSVENIENQGLRMIRELEGIDILLTGHMHQNINSIINDTVVVQPGYAGESVIEIDIEVDNNEVDVLSTVYSVANYSEDNLFLEMIQAEYSQVIQWKDSIIGRIELLSPYNHTLDTRLYGHPFMEMINQLQLKITAADFSASSLINDSYVDFNGDISNEHLLEAFPFHNNVAVVELSGEDLINALQHNFSYFEIKNNHIFEPNIVEGVRAAYLDYDVYSGLEVIIDFKRPKDSRVVEVIDKRTQKAIEKKKMYTLALSQFRASGGRGYEEWFDISRIKLISQQSILDLVTLLLKGDIKINMENVNQNYSQIKEIIIE